MTTALDSRLVLDQVDAVPDHDTFLGVDDLLAAGHALATQRPEVAAMRRIGSSRNGEPLWSLTVGDGPRDAVVVAFPHPNEPFGGLTALHLARSVATDADLRTALGMRWHVVLCSDPDGTRLNEGWFGAGLDRERYARGFYRPAGDEQVEWTFPLDHRGAYFDRLMPETVALMRLLDDTRPALMGSLHNGESGGAYYYLSRELPQAYELLRDVPRGLGLPLAEGEPEMPFTPQLAPAIFRTGTIADAYAYLDANGVDAAGAFAGDSSAGYAADRHGTLTVVPEVPYWLDARADDHTPVDARYADVLRAHCDELIAAVQVLLDAQSATAPVLRLDTPFRRALTGLGALVLDEARASRARADRPEADRPATVAERWSLDAALHAQRLRQGGMLLRVLDAELGAGNTAEPLRRARAVTEERFQAWLVADAAHLSGRPVPYRAPVATQYAAVLTCALALA